MSSVKPKINIQRALRELSLEVSQRYEVVEHPLTEISSNLPSSSKDISRKGSQTLQRSSKKSNKENLVEAQPAKTGQEERTGKNNTYVAISKALEHKTQLIGQQKHEIEVLRQCVEDVKHNKQTRAGEEARNRAQGLAVLKATEKEYLDGLSEIIGLKESLEDIKRKYHLISAERNALQQERNVLASRFDSLFAESEELTIAITHLKLEKEEREAASRTTEEEVAVLKEQLKAKGEAEQRAVGLERRLRECLDKLAEAQEQLSACQMKYYRLQQEGDLLREDGEQRLASALRQCRTEREEHEQEIARFMASQRQAEQRAAQQERAIADLQEERRREGSVELTRLAERLRESEETNERLRQEGRQWESYTKELTRQCQLEKDAITATIRAQASSLRQDIEILTGKLETASTQREAAELKILQLINERERMLSHFSGVVGEKEEEAKLSRSLLMRSEEELASLRDSMEAKTRQEGQILRKIETLEQRLTQDNDRLVQLNSSLQQQSDRIAAERDSLEEEKIRLRAQLCILRDRDGEVRYYQQKYEQQLLEYNSLSEYSHSVEVQHAALLSSHTALLLETNTLKAELTRLTADLAKLSSAPHPQLLSLKAEIAELRQELSAYSGETASLRAEAARASSEAWREREAGRGWRGRAEELESALREVRGQLAGQVEEVRRLRAAVNYAEDQYRSLQEQHEDQVAVWERQCEAVRLQHSQLRDSRLSAEYELDSKEAAVCVLREENVELQRIFSVQLERRNAIIRQLMAEKRSLYGQLAGREGAQ